MLDKKICKRKLAVKNMEVESLHQSGHRYSLQKQKHTFSSNKTKKRAGLDIKCLRDVQPCNWGVFTALGWTLLHPNYPALVIVMDPTKNVHLHSGVWSCIVIHDLKYVRKQGVLSWRLPFFQDLLLTSFRLELTQMLKSTRVENMLNPNSNIEEELLIQRGRVSYIVKRDNAKQSQVCHISTVMS